VLDELIKQIEELLTSKSPVVIAISGHGGSGKSTLADKLADHFGISENQIVRTDGLHAKNYMQAPDIFQHHDWETIMHLFSSIRSTDRLVYLKRDSDGVESTVDVPRPPVVIVEGIRLLRPEVMPYTDLSVWIDCPLELATKRAKERNRLQGDSDAEIALWDTKWTPESRLYYDRVQPQRLASFIYKEYE
jgi:uridine kinase